VFVASPCPEHQSLEALPPPEPWNETCFPQEDGFLGPLGKTLMMPSTHRARPALLLTGALLLAGLSLGCGEKPPEVETTPPAPAKWIEAQKKFPEEWIDLLGTTQPLPNRTARITAPIEGQVVAVLQRARGFHPAFAASSLVLGASPLEVGPFAATAALTNARPVVEGQRVNKGDIIVQLDVRVARANRDKAKAALNKLDDQDKQAQVAVDLAQVEVNRLNKLKAGRITVAESDIQKAALLLKEAKLKKEGVKNDRAAAQADLNALEIQLALHTLTTPIDGRLGRLLVVPGQTLAVGTQVAEVVDLDDQIDVLCFVPPRVARQLKKAQREFGVLAARMGAVGEQGVKTAGSQGKVVFISDQAELDSGNIAVKVRFPNKVLGLRANTTVRITVQTNSGKECWTLQESAVFEDEEPPAVIAVEEEKGKDKEGKEVDIFKARKVRVELGIRDRNLKVVEILKVWDPEKQWKGSRETSKFVFKRGQGLRTGDVIKEEVDED
jgi:RND family efflux transporter MFP subunit